MLVKTNTPINNIDGGWQSNHPLIKDKIFATYHDAYIAEVVASFTSTLNDWYIKYEQINKLLL